ncbi:MAG: putative selenate reductase subunit YgfK, partial [Treponema sp.]|nr:putative selenate reductase subunit YgfK [Treponema sp.]
MMRPVPFPQLISLIQGGYKRHGKVFGIPKEKFFNYAEQTESASEQGCFEIFGSRIASPIGPAAGPHTQLAQNILAAYLTGARFMELKTVQTLDGEELSKCIARPCIAVPDEGYNVEWSTELTVDEARAEYIKAWFLCHIFAKEFRIASGFVFNMSVGYSYDGIKSAKIDSYIEGLKNARNTEIWNDCYNYIAANIDMFNSFNKDDLAAVSPHVSNNITLSTLHGCPREEIEKIAAYLITEKGLHTYVKCNPTLLGYETARRLLDEAGFTGISFDDHHFKNDLQLTDAVEMLGRLRALASEHRLDFGVKLTNTFPVQIKRNELPGNEMYMSGRSLFHLSINVAKKLSDAFNGGLPISYSGGADYFNAEAILETGIRPVTVATELLKPGGYERFNQLAELAQKTKKGSSKITSIPIINLKALNNLAVSFSRHPRYKKEYRQGRSQRSSPRRTKDSALPPIPLFDCFKAPCADSQSGCPISQDIPRYLAAVAEGDYRAAFAIIARDNTAPSITGTVCDHRCQQCCTRADYEDPLQIRQAKLIAADNAQEAFIESLQASELKTGKSAAIIGAGPAGIAAAVFLRRNGVPVTVYEKRDRPFGMAQYVIPAFRISDAAIRRDFLMAQKYGVEFVFNVPEEYSIPELRKKHEFIVLATGAWRESPPLAHGKMVIGALRFLEDSKKTGCGLDLGKRVAVIGGGDVAMDCARAAIRNRGVEQAVIVYRRTREFMPAQHEEQVQALADGVIFREL